VKALRHWFREVQRPLPWREQASPYAVWVSEVMLQQTQVSVVIPYFRRWMERFPTIAALAEASEEEVIKLWEGLGYYSRARNLHQGAQYVVAHYGGELPADADALSRIKGVGPYTVGAILSFAFHKRAPAVDGNVARVVSRYLAIQEEVDRPKVQRQIVAEVEKLLPQERSWEVMEALIELGALICQKRPKCHLCPLHSSCRAHALHLQLELPKKTKRPKTVRLIRLVAVVMGPRGLLVRRVPKGEVMAGLYEFPYFEVSREEASGVDLPRRLAKLGIDAELRLALDPVDHTFTRYRARLLPWVFHGEGEAAGYEWQPDLEGLAFSSGHRRILSQAEWIRCGASSLPEQFLATTPL
jgi:A/G-specific adenine glycosylase